MRNSLNGERVGGKQENEQRIRWKKNTEEKNYFLIYTMNFLLQVLDLTLIKVIGM